MEISLLKIFFNMITTSVRFSDEDHKAFIDFKHVFFLYFTKDRGKMTLRF